MRTFIYQTNRGKVTFKVLPHKPWRCLGGNRRATLCLDLPLCTTHWSVLQQIYEIRKTTNKILWAAEINAKKFERKLGTLVATG